MTPPHDPLRTASTRDPIPRWINALQVVIIAILAYQTYAAYLAQSRVYSGAIDDRLSSVIFTLAGRNAMMLVVSLIALRRQNAAFYAFAFLMHLLRDAQDMFIVPLTDDGSTSSRVIVFVVFTSIFVLPEALALKKLRDLARRPPAMPAW